MLIQSKKTWYTLKKCSSYFLKRELNL